MSLMFQRQIHDCSLSPGEMEADLQVLVDVLGNEFLHRTSIFHPVVTLWWRKDWLATVELLVLGRAVRLLRESSAPATLERWAKDVREESGGQLDGLLWEAYAAGLLGDSSQRVSLAAVNQPGFDILVKLTRGHQVRVSCKRIRESDAERAFLTHAHKTYQAIRGSLGPGAPLEITLYRPIFAPRGHKSAELRGRGADVARKLQKAVIASLTDGQRGAIRAARHQITVTALPSTDGAVISRRTNPRSMQISYVSGRSPNDQLRFNAKVRDGCRNMEKHLMGLMGPEPGWSNALAVRVPHSISLQLANNWLHEFFGHEAFPCVSVVLVVRPTVHWSRASSFDYRYHLAYESFAFDNPNAPKIPEPVYLTSHLGRPHTGNSVIELSSPTLGIVESTDHYIYVDGHIAYEQLPVDLPGLGLPVLPHCRVSRVESIPDGPTLVLGGEVGTDLLGLRERPRPFDLTLL